MTARHDEPTTDPRADVVDDWVDDSVDSPTAFPGVAIAGGLFGVVLLVGGGFLVRDVLAAAGVIGGDTWVHRVAVQLGGQTWADWMWVLPIAAVVLGLAALWLAVKPRRRTHVAMTDRPGVWTRRVDVARRVSAAVTDLPDVRRAVTVTGRRQVKVLVTTVGPVDLDRAAGTARAAVGASAVADRIRIKVKTDTATTVKAGKRVRS